MKPIATVINNNQPGLTNIVETEPHVTLDVGTKLFVEDEDDLFFSGDELNLIRQWFNSVMDVTPEFLDSNDYKLAVRIYEKFGWTVTKKMRDCAR